MNDNVEIADDRNLGWGEAMVWAMVAIAGFHLAYLVPGMAWVMAGFCFALVQLTGARTGRIAFYVAMFVGFGIYTPHLWFFTGIFHVAAVALWGILAIWLAAFVVLARALRRIAGNGKRQRWLWTALLPVLWMGLEYFRGELNPLRFGWLTPGFAFGASRLVQTVGVYGVGFVMMAVAAVAFLAKQRWWMILLLVGAVSWIMPSGDKAIAYSGKKPDLMVGIQLEFPSERQLIAALDEAVRTYPDVSLLVLSEYTLPGPPGEMLTGWCRANHRHLIVGGIQPGVTEDQWTDTAFVIDPNGAIVFSQGKCVPIQFFSDGKPAQQQRIWDSPFGKVGICICYDLSYTRVTDELVRQGAEILIVPTMDAESWGAYQHGLHARVAPVRAVEYGIPIVRVGSSGISQFVRPNGSETRASFPGQGEMISGRNYQQFSHVGGHLPVDRWMAPVCVGLTVAALLVVIGDGMRRRFKRR